LAEYVYRPVISVAVGVFRALDLKLDVHGQENVPARGGGVVLINHVGYLDFALAGVPFWYAQRRLVRFMAKSEVFGHPVGGPLMRGMHHIPVDRAAGAGSFRAAVTVLRSGELVGVFPEATIHPHYCLAPFKSGATRMATSAKVPVIPVIVWGSQRILTKGRKIPLRAARHTPVSITVGKPVPPSDLADRNAGTELLVEVMTKMLDEAQRRYPAPLPGEPDWWQPAHLGGSAPPLPAGPSASPETFPRKKTRTKADPETGSSPGPKAGPAAR
jgi:1-acyl-sn-glycerol-3-phosphate acyltransferase